MLRWHREVLAEAVKPSVARRYLTSVAQLDAVLGRMRVDQITTRTIADYVSARKGKASNATIRRDLTALSSLLSACVAWGWRPDNPALAYDRKLLRERRDPIVPPTREELEHVLAHAPPGMAAILRLLDQTGMREAEAVTLERHEVEWQRRQITLTRTKTDRPRTLDWRTPGGDAGPVLEALPTAVAHGPLFRNGRGLGYRNFSSNFGQLMSRLERAAKAEGRPFRRFRVHDLRHGFAIRWLKEGGSIYDLSVHLGRASVKTTEMYLGYLTAEEQHRARRGPQAEPRDGAGPQTGPQQAL